MLLLFIYIEGLAPVLGSGAGAWKIRPVVALEKDTSGRARDLRLCVHRVRGRGELSVTGPPLALIMTQ